MVRSLATTFVLLVACSKTCPPPVAPPTATAATIGETFRITSKVLGEERVVNVYLPPGYAEGTTRFPVLYMPDGGMNEDFPHIAGGADKFRRFLADELKPYVASRYRVSEESAIIGESLAGLFVIETLLVEPALFDAYIAADPSVWWNQVVLVKSAPERFARWNESPKRLFVATADHKEMQEGVGLLMTAIRERAPTGLVAQHVPMPDEQHHTIFPFAALRGIRTVFAR